MKNIKQKIQEEIAYAKDRMITYDETYQKSNSDVELGVARGLNMALDFIKEEELEKEELKKPEFLMTKEELEVDAELEAMNQELELDANRDLKLEEDVVNEEDLEKETL